MWEILFSNLIGKKVFCLFLYDMNAWKSFERIHVVFYLRKYYIWTFRCVAFWVAVSIIEYFPSYFWKRWFFRHIMLMHNEINKKSFQIKLIMYLITDLCLSFNSDWFNVKHDVIRMIFSVIKIILIMILFAIFCVFLLYDRFFMFRKINLLIFYV